MSFLLYQVTALQQVKVQLSLYLIKHHDKKAYVGMEVGSWLHKF
jgi:hypothetical protein